MRNIAEQTAEAATKMQRSAFWEILGMKALVTSYHILSHLITSYHPTCKLSMDIAIKRKFYEVNSNPAFPWLCRLILGSIQFYMCLIDHVPTHGWFKVIHGSFTDQSRSVCARQRARHSRESGPDLINLTNLGWLGLIENPNVFEPRRLLLVREDIAQWRIIICK